MKKRTIAIGAVIIAAIASAATFSVGSLLVRPRHVTIGPAPSTPPLEQVEFQSGAGVQLRAWFARGMPGAGGILLLHGVRADRRSMLGRAKFLHANGYSVLLVDFQAHGESEGKQITFGILESEDVHSSVEFLRRRLPGEPIGVIGTSLGGAACLLGPEPLKVNALVLEAVYPNVRQAIQNRLRIRFGPPGAWLTPLLTLQIKLRLGFSPAQLSPINSIPNLLAPVLIIAGENDRRTTVTESEALYSAAPNPKDLWIVAGAAHVDFHHYAPRAYEDRILKFLALYMKRRG